MDGLKININTPKKDSIKHLRNHRIQALIPTVNMLELEAEIETHISKFNLTVLVPKGTKFEDLQEVIETQIEEGNYIVNVNELDISEIDIDKFQYLEGVE